MSCDYWKQTLDGAKEEFSEHVYKTWICPLEKHTLRDGGVFVQVPNNLYKEKIQKYYHAFLINKYRFLSANPNATLGIEVIRPKLGVAIPPSTLQKNTKPAAKTDKLGSSNLKLASHFTFESFVVGANSQLAVAAAKSVAQAPGKKFNPLLVYGAVGLGKTHILHAIAHKVLEVGKRVIFKSSEGFVNDLIQSIRFEKMDQFRKTYRKCDVLLIDDIQFLSGKERTQEEFFHTFNALFQENKQIVLTSDRLPAQMPELDDRLRSRFQSGLFCDISLPDLETRVAIINQKAESLSLCLSCEVSSFLASHITTNIRTIEGALIRLSAMASLYNKPIDLQNAQSVVAALMIAQKKTSVEHILKTVAHFFNLTPADLKSSRRKKTIAQPRHIAMFLARKLTEMSYPELGKRFGGRDHTTVMHGYRKIEMDLKINTKLQNCISAIEKSILS